MAAALNRISMGLLRTKKADPISERARSLNAQIAALEDQIRQLDAQLQSPPAPTRPRTTAAARRPGPALDLEPEEPVFESVDHRRVTTQADPESTPGHFNDLGVRKYDLAAAWRRFQRHLQGPTSSNPKLINYLAAGSIKGLKPLRYEKRVARNRVIAMTLILVAVLWGILAAFYRH
jgi:hypothetical protein